MSRVQKKLRFVTGCYRQEFFLIHNAGSNPSAQHTDVPIILISLQIIMIINRIDHWWIHEFKNPVNGCQARAKSLPCICIWIPLPAKCSGHIGVGHVSTWSLNCLKRTHWRYNQKAVTIHHQHEISYCHSNHQTVITCLTVSPQSNTYVLPSAPQSVLSWNDRDSQMRFTHAEHWRIALQVEETHWCLEGY